MNLWFRCNTAARLHEKARHESTCAKFVRISFPFRSNHGAQIFPAKQPPRTDRVSWFVATRAQLTLAEHSPCRTRLRIRCRRRRNSGFVEIIEHACRECCRSRWRLGRSNRDLCVGLLVVRLILSTVSTRTAGDYRRWQSSVERFLTIIGLRRHRRARSVTRSTEFPLATP